MLRSAKGNAGVGWRSSPKSPVPLPPRRIVSTVTDTVWFDRASSQFGVADLIRSQICVPLSRFHPVVGAGIFADNPRVSRLVASRGHRMVSSPDRSTTKRSRGAALDAQVAGSQRTLAPRRLRQVRSG